MFWCPAGWVGAQSWSRRRRLLTKRLARRCAFAWRRNALMFSIGRAASAFAPGASRFSQREEAVARRRGKPASDDSLGPRSKVLVALLPAAAGEVAARLCAPGRY